MYDIKQSHLDSFNDFFQLKETELIFYDPAYDIPGNHITEIDGLFEVIHHSLDGYTVTKELVIVESKLEFGLEQLQSKLNILRKLKQLFRSPLSEFKDTTYGRFINRLYSDYEKITMFNGTPQWKVDLDNLYIVNNTIYDRHQIPHEKRAELRALDATDFSPLSSKNFIEELYDDDVLYKLTERPDLKFVIMNDGVFMVHGDMSSLSGGSDLITDSD